jgi:uncharacterized BrkB/YihY/UPF0761 family membrane protein
MVRKDKRSLSLNERAKKSLKSRAQVRYRYVNRLSQGTLEIFIEAVRSFHHARAAEGAASIAYYALFSLFPLLFFLVATVVIAGSLIGLLLILSLFLTTAFNLLPQLSIPLLGDVSIYKTLLWHVLSRLIPWLLTYLVFLLLYWWIPNTKVNWSEANWGALAATFAWEFNRAGFIWYLNSGLARYQLVYGSLGALVALMLWIYLSSLIALFGAHLSAAIAAHSQAKNEKKGLTRYQTYIKP